MVTRPRGLAPVGRLRPWRRVRRSATPRFVDETAASGLDHRYDGEFEFFVGGGVAAFDCDGDGRAELFLAGGSEPAALYHNDSPVGGALRFSPMPSPVTDLTAVTGAYPLDVDSDGDTDLVVLAARRRVRAARSGRVPVRAGERGARARRRRTAGRRRSARRGRARTRCRRWPSAIPHAGRRAAATTAGCCDPTLPVRRTPPPVALAPGYCTLSMLFSDWSRSGRRDLRVTNDRHYYRDGEEQLWRIAPDEPPRPYTEADGWRPLQIWGMGIASQDVTGDGYARGVPDQPGRQQAADAGRRTRRGRRTGHRARRAGSPRTGRSPAVTCCRRPRGTPSSRT